MLRRRSRNPKYKYKRIRGGRDKGELDACMTRGGRRTLSIMASVDKNVAHRWPSRKVPIYYVIT